MADIVFAACTSHAPYLTISNLRAPRDYLETVERVRSSLVELGREMERRGVETLLVVGGDHFETFFLDNFPAINVYVDDRAYGLIDGQRRPYRVDVELAKEVLFGLMEEGFDPSFSQGPFRLTHAVISPTYWMFKAREVPIVPIHVNTNIDPMVSPQRAFKLGEALANVLRRSKTRGKVGIIGTGGLSHYPGTPLYGKVDEEFDRRFVKMMEEGSVEELRKLTADDLEASGNLETRAWLTVLGAIKRRARVILFERTYHIDYALVQFEL